MNPNKKPEWFELAEVDNAATVRKVSKKLPVLALVGVAAILGVGAVMAQTQEESPASATETVVADPSLTPATSSASNESVTPATSTAKPKIGVVTPPAAQASSVPNPKIGVLPKGGEHQEGGENDPENEEGDD